MLEHLLIGIGLAIAMRAQESQAPAKFAEHGLSDVIQQELRQVLDEEVQRLPEKYRAPFVLCCLEGRGRKEAAAEFGWKEGTVSSRIASWSRTGRCRESRFSPTVSPERVS